MIGSFEGPVEISLTGEFVRRREVVELMEPLTYKTAADVANPRLIIIDIGARSDGVSSPWWAWWISPPLGREVRAAFLHDHLLANRSRYPFTRAQIDRMFRESMRCLGTSQWKRNLMWLAVRWQAVRTRDR